MCGRRALYDRVSIEHPRRTKAGARKHISREMSSGDHFRSLSLSLSMVHPAIAETYAVSSARLASVSYAHSHHYGAADERNGFLRFVSRAKIGALFCPWIFISLREF